MSKLRALTGIAIAACLAAGSVSAADAIPYPASGAYNPVTYSFFAAADGDIIAYIVGGFGAGYENELGLLVNGVQQSDFALNNHTSAAGDSFNFGSVFAGDELVFVLHNIGVGDAYSDPSLNAAYDSLFNAYSGPHNHIYSTNYTADPGIAGVPLGTYVAFEDIPFGDGADYNYDDESFVFTNTRAIVGAGVPEPSTWALLIAGFGLAGAGLRNRRRAVATA